MILLQVTAGRYFNLTRGSYIEVTHGTNMTGAEFDFIMETDPHSKRSARIAIKAINGLYWSVTDKYVKAQSSKPVYFYMSPVQVV